ncbi:MAG: cysteine hydrolase [Ferrovibrio sp.]|uniref:cysteine hydrolase family protein n=1 Tax=Ferrovibrio sp. TaxID=1917215 RepID=UPI0026047F11|nr:cysteine hydrolase family protein [Ferrovibrio sp.]MCW0234525.1 cysteine hydrolase [Ferrovibrio sp.]
MSRPKTLLEMAGAAGIPVLWEKSTLLLVDHQNEYLADGGLPLTGIDAAVAEIGRLLAAARASGAPVVHVRHHGRPGGALFNPESPKAEFIAGVQPRETERIVTKTLPNSFAKTDLDAVLKELGRSELIIAGFQTHMCISATARSAIDHGYRGVVVASACADRDLPDPTGTGTIGAAEMHRITLAALNDRFALVVPNAAAIA